MSTVTFETPDVGGSSTGPAGTPTGPGTGPPPESGRLARILRGRRQDALWVRPALLALLAVTAVLYLWDLSASGWANSFYSAAVQAGTKSWKAFFFGSFDSSNFITVDKSPAALWVMELSARIFGLSSWSILVPNALEGVATVGLLYLTVRRWFSPAAGLLAGAVVALTPVAALMFRYNNPDAFLILLLTAAAYATTRAVESGRTRWIVLAGALVGFGFLAKMLQAFLVLPGFGLVYLIAAPNSLWRRVRQLALGAVAVAVAAGWWVLVVQLTPATDRPYVGGSQDNSLWNLIFGYNGFGRLTGNETGSVGGGGGAGGGSQWGPTGLTRLFRADMGSQISWLLPAALILLVAGLAYTWRAPRTDRTRAALILWGGWLLATGLAFSLGQGIIHPYYTVALAPAIGALIGIGGAVIWTRRHRADGRALLGLVVVVSSVWAWVLLQRSPAWEPLLRVAAVLLGGACVLGLLAWSEIGRGARRAVVALGLAACLAAPAAYTLDTVATPHSGAIPSAGPAVTGATGAGPGRGAGFAGGGGAAASNGGGFPSAGTRGGSAPGVGGGGFGSGLRGGPGGAGGSTGAGAGTSAGGRGPGTGGGLLSASQPSAKLVSFLKDGARGYEWVLATVGANEAAGYQLSTGDAVMAIGGFNGTDPAPTLAEFEKLVADGKIHYFLADGGSISAPGLGSGGSTATQITNWVESHFHSTTVGGVILYVLKNG